MGKHVDSTGTRDMSKRWGMFQSPMLPRHRVDTPTNAYNDDLDIDEVDPLLAPRRATDHVNAPCTVRPILGDD